MDPDTQLTVTLNGTARRLAAATTDPATAMNELREIAGNRTDTLGTVAGNMIGGYLGNALTNPQCLLAAYYLALAGAEHDDMVTAADEVRARTGRGGYSLGGRCVAP